jgi:hypothetical protein
MPVSWIWRALSCEASTKMQPRQARTIAERLHLGDRDVDGARMLTHIRRVVRSTPDEACTVAWLHEALESGAVSERALLEAGLDEDELRALRLVSRPPWPRSDRGYMAHIELIACAAGRSGRLARTVKIADLRDRLAHPRAQPDDWLPPYARGLQRLLGAVGADAAVAMG